MLNPIRTKQFKKDYKLCSKRNLDLNKLKKVMMLLAYEAPLPPKLLNHALHGNWIGFQECHIEPDWLLVYRISQPDIIFIRTGSHSDIL